MDTFNKKENRIYKPKWLGFLYALIAIVKLIHIVVKMLIEKIIQNITEFYQKNI